MNSAEGSSLRAKKVVINVAGSRGSPGETPEGLSPSPQKSEPDEDAVHLNLQQMDSRSVTPQDASFQPGVTPQSKVKGPGQLSNFADSA
jgi:hypothetical protein